MESKVAPATFEVPIVDATKADPTRKPSRQLWRFYLPSSFLEKMRFSSPTKLAKHGSRATLVGRLRFSNVWEEQNG
jgi:hypothetical protein